MRILPFCIFTSVTYFMIGEREERDWKEKGKREKGKEEKRSLISSLMSLLGFQLDVVKCFKFSVP